MRTLFLLVALVLSAGDSEAPAPWAQSITGTITDAVTGQPVQGARVLAVGTALEARSARDGTYALVVGTELTGEITVRVVAIGYAPAEQRVTLTGDPTTLDFAMSAAPVDANEILADVANRLEEGRSDKLRTLPSTVAVAPIRARNPAGYRPWDRPTFPESGNRETYEAIVENPFTAAGAVPLSTFSIDVDRAAYANMRRFIRAGQLPPPDAVRIEELINYFSYDYPEPTGDHPFSVTSEVAPAPWQPEHYLVRIGIQGRSIDTADLPPSNLVFLIDVSGSMNSPDKLPLLKSAFRLLVNQLRPEDRVSMVVYAGAAGLVLEPTPGSEKEKILEALDNLRAGGSTAGGAGLRLAYEIAGKSFREGGNNRVILATDGDFNVGLSSDQAMVELIEKKREEGTFLTVLGFGTGNLQDAKMEKIADHGNGNFAYIDSLLEAQKVLVGEMGGTLHTIAKDVKVQVEFNPARVKAYRLIGYENRIMAEEDFDDDRKDAVELGAGHSVTALYEVIPAGVETDIPIRGTTELRYQNRGDLDLTATAESTELMFVKLRYKQPDGDSSVLLDRTVPDRAGALSEDFRFAASVAAFGMILRGSPHAGSASLEAVSQWARASLGEDREGYRREFVQLVDAAAALMATEDRQES
jgi:Ca-activated chloride channel homolog